LKRKPAGQATDQNKCTLQGPVPPRPVHRAGEELDAEAPEPLGFGVDVVDEEQDLAGRAPLGGLAADQGGGACALEEPEPRLAGDELCVSGVAELDEEPDHVPIERGRCLQIADVQDHIAEARHGHHRTTAGSGTSEAICSGRGTWAPARYFLAASK
jgi:hypothetical protein